MSDSTITFLKMRNPISDETFSFKKILQLEKRLNKSSVKEPATRSGTTTSVLINPPGNKLELSQIKSSERSWFWL